MISARDGDMEIKIETDSNLSKKGGPKQLSGFGGIKVENVEDVE